MKHLKVTRIEKRFSGYGHNNITVTVSGKLINDYGDVEDVKDCELKCTSNNTTATDAYFSEYYDENFADFFVAMSFATMSVFGGVGITSVSL